MSYCLITEEKNWCPLLVSLTRWEIGIGRNLTSWCKKYTAVKNINLQCCYNCVADTLAQCTFGTRWPETPRPRYLRFCPEKIGNAATSIRNARTRWCTRDRRALVTFAIFPRLMPPEKLIREHRASMVHRNCGKNQIWGWNSRKFCGRSHRTPKNQE